MVIGDGNEIVLDCYRLARFYHQSPQIFLAMPISEVHLHLRRTIELRNLQRQSDDDDDG